MKNTIRIIHYLLLIALTFLTFVFFQSYVILYFLVALLLLPFLSIAVTRFAFRRIEVITHDKLYVTNKDSNFTINVQIKNPTIIPLPSCTLILQIGNCFYPNPETQTIHIPIYAMNSQIISIPAKSLYSGMIKINLLEFDTNDFLHLYNFHSILKHNSEIMVLPYSDVSVTIDESIVGYGNDISVNDQKKGEDLTEIKDIREYQMGDRIQSIHWKLSIKKDELMVKEYENLSSHQQILLFELYKDETLLLDSILDMVCSLSHYLMRMNADWKLMWWSVNESAFHEEEIHSEEDLWNAFARLFYETPYSNPTYAYELFREQEMSTHNFLYVSRENREIIGRELAHFKKHVTAIFVSDA